MNNEDIRKTLIHKKGNLCKKLEDLERHWDNLRDEFEGTIDPRTQARISYEMDLCDIDISEVTEQLNDVELGLIK
jgi:hypothetical protein